MIHEAWLDVAQVEINCFSSSTESSSSAAGDRGDQQEKSTPKALSLFLPGSTHSELTSTTVRWIPDSISSCPPSSATSSSSAAVVKLHPFLYEFLTLAAAAQERMLENELAVAGCSTTTVVHDAAAVVRTGHSLQEDLVPITLSPFPGFDLELQGSRTKEEEQAVQKQFCARSIDSDVLMDLPENARVQVQYIHIENDGDNKDDPKILSSQRIASALQGRWIQKSTTQILCLGGREHVALIVKDILIQPTRTTGEKEQSSGVMDTPKYSCYRVGPPNSYALEILPSFDVPKKTSPSIDENDNATMIQSPSRGIAVHPNDSHGCLGYETQVEQLVQLLQLPPSARPTGILLTGSAGVGKTRLVQCATAQLAVQQQQQQRKKSITVHRVSVHDLVLQASWATEDDLMASLRPQLVKQDPKLDAVLVIDDLDAAGGENDNDDSNSTNDQERRLVRNAIVRILDEMVRRNVPVLGIGTEASQLPSELVKVGRFEKEIFMLPPSQSQREQILRHMLHSLVNEDEQDVHHQWAELLATLTAGCVASDLQRLCADAFNRSLARINSCSRSAELFQSIESAAYDGDGSSLRPQATWDDLAEAARNCVPSQLAALDVTKPKNFLLDCTANDWPRIHELSWMPFAGYSRMKKRVYRTVVVPWRRFLSADVLLASSSATTNGSKSIAPPSGILFHGASGCGKTKAADCLGSSLGLPMIKVRAADVLDKWLGGSEAAIRSLFKRARAAAPSILLFDEIDAIASNRAHNGATVDVMSRLLSTLLNEMDGVSSGLGSKVFVIACTNRLETLDAALLRPGRLEEHILLETPGLHDIKDLLHHGLARAPLGKGLDLDSVAADLADKSVSSAMVEGVCREAVFQALRRCPRYAPDLYLTMDDIQNAMVALKILDIAV